MTKKTTCSFALSGQWSVKAQTVFPPLLLLRPQVLSGA